MQELKARVEELQEQIRQLKAEVEAMEGEYRAFRRLAFADTIERTVARCEL